MRTKVAVGVGFAALLSTVMLAQGGRKVTGVVTAAATRQPVADAHVQYAEDDGTVQTTRTDSKGRFEIPHGAAGIVTVTAGRFGTAKRAWPPREGYELRFNLIPPATAVGVIMDAATRQPAEGLVTLVVRHPFNLVSRTARTRRGEFRFNDLPPGPAIIYAHADGFAPYFGTLTIDAGKQRSVRVGLLLEAAASGSVLDREGNPAAGARVRVGYGRALPGGGILSGLARGNVTADSDGAFSVGGLVPDTPIALQAELDGRRSDIVTITVEPGMMQSSVVLRLP